MPNFLASSLSNEDFIIKEEEQHAVNNSELLGFHDYTFPPRRNSTTIISPSTSFSSSLFNTAPKEPFREQRSMSFSFVDDQKLFNNTNQHHYLYLDTIMQEEDEEEEEFERTRSKSTAAIMDNSIWCPTKQDSNWNNKRVQDDEINNIRERMRRFSLAPPTTGFLENNTNLLNHDPFSSFINQRRHSVAGPAISNDQIISDLAIREKIPHTTEIMKADDMGKGTRLDSDTLKSALFYVIEFKGGRSDVYYSTTTMKKDNLVIVEADRGRDLGKITKENISRDQLETYYSQLKNSNLEEKKKYLPNEIYIKCIFRLARSDEITLLIAKSQDETKALMVCQSKIKQKKLNMKVVDAEYQWDRRKLTFYFIAEKRVDFRELVRELFKLYKTRIWMCAVNSIIHL